MSVIPGEGVYVIILAEGQFIALIRVGVCVSPWGLFLWPWFHATCRPSIFTVFQLPDTLGKDPGFLLGYPKTGLLGGGPKLDKQGQSAPGLPGLQLGTVPC